MEPATLRRHAERALYDEESIAAVFADSFFAHVSYIDNGFPQNLPMIALFRRFGDDPPSVYLHGHPTTRLIELVKQQQKRAEEGLGTDDDEIKVCITATKVDGLAVSSAPNGHAFNYRSAVVHGKCIWITDKDRKRAVMEAVTNHIIPNRWEETNPVASVRLALVQVIRVDIAKASLKIRSGRPPIQPRNPAKDGPDRDEPVWTGIIPLYETLGGFVPSGLTPEATVSKNLETFVQGRNERCRRKAEESSVDETYGYPINN